MKQEKAPYIAKAESKKTEYVKTMQQYNMKLVWKLFFVSWLCIFVFYECCQIIPCFLKANGTKTTGDDDSDKSKSEVNDEEEAGTEEVINPPLLWCL